VRIFAGNVFLEHGYFSAEKFLVFAPPRLQGSKKISRKDSFWWLGKAAVAVFLLKSMRLV
jgi:hypothetical protein